MRIEHHDWYSPRLGHDMGVAVFGHWGPPLLAFPTSHGDEWELQRHGLIDALGEFVEAGRVKIFCVGSNNHESFLNKGAHPFHRSWRQRMFDEYIREEVFPFIYASTQSAGIPIATMGASLGGVSRGEHALPLPAPGQALLRAVGDLRPARVHGRHVRRQLLLPQSGRLPGQPAAIRGHTSSSRPARSGW